VCVIAVRWWYGGHEQRATESSDEPVSATSDDDQSRHRHQVAAVRTQVRGRRASLHLIATSVAFTDQLYAFRKLSSCTPCLKKDPLLRLQVGYLYSTNVTQYQQFLVHRCKLLLEMEKKIEGKEGREWKGNQRIWERDGKLLNGKENGSG